MSLSIGRYSCFVRFQDLHCLDLESDPWILETVQVAACNAYYMKNFRSISNSCQEAKSSEIEGGQYFPMFDVKIVIMLLRSVKIYKWFVKSNPVVQIKSRLKDAVFREISTSEDDQVSNVL